MVIRELHLATKLIIALNIGIGKKPNYKLDVQGDITTYGTLREWHQIFDLKLPYNHSQNQWISYDKYLPFLSFQR